MFDADEVVVGVDLCRLGFCVPKRVFKAGNRADFSSAVRNLAAYVSNTERAMESLNSTDLYLKSVLYKDASEGLVYLKKQAPDGVTLGVSVCGVYVAYTLLWDAAADEIQLKVKTDSGDKEVRLKLRDFYTESNKVKSAGIDVQDSRLLSALDTLSKSKVERDTVLGQLAQSKAWGVFAACHAFAELLLCDCIEAGVDVSDATKILLASHPTLFQHNPQMFVAKYVESPIIKQWLLADASIDALLSNRFWTPCYIELLCVLNKLAVYKPLCDKLHASFSLCIDTVSVGIDRFRVCSTCSNTVAELGGSLNLLDCYAKCCAITEKKELICRIGVLNEKYATLHLDYLKLNKCVWTVDMPTIWGFTETPHESLVAWSSFTHSVEDGNYVNILESISKKQSLVREVGFKVGGIEIPELKSDVSLTLFTCLYAGLDNGYTVDYLEELKKRLNKCVNKPKYDFSVFVERLFRWLTTREMLCRNLSSDEHKWYSDIKRDLSVAHTLMCCCVVETLLRTVDDVGAKGIKTLIEESTDLGELTRKVLLKFFSKENGTDGVDLRNRLAHGYTSDINLDTGLVLDDELVMMCTFLTILLVDILYLKRYGVVSSV